MSLATHHRRRSILAASLLSLLAVTGAAHTAEFSSQWEATPDRVWAGESYWANRLQDWHIANGRLECLADPNLPLRTVHLLTHQLGKQGGSFQLNVATGTSAAAIGDDSATGMLIGVGRGMMDYRAAAIVHNWAGPGGGLFVGIDGKGRLLVADNEKSGRPRIAESPSAVVDPRNVTLRLTAQPDGDQYQLTLAVFKDDSITASGKIEASVPASRLVGNIALACDPGKQTTHYWYQRWTASGEKITHNPNATFGPIACTQYTLSRRILKLTAQFLPLQTDSVQQVDLQVQDGPNWKTVARAPIIVPGWTATFRVPDWDDSRDTAYRVAWNDHIWSGTIRKDPAAKETIVVAGFTGNHNNSHRINSGRPGNRNSRLTDWPNVMWFPHTEISESVRYHKPDVLFYSGDQVYEGNSPTFADRKHIKLDYLYKWYLWCWAYRDLTRHIPTITIPDDHDVYQGNIWGQGGRKSPNRDHDGGYVHPADFVQMVERTQTSHLPDPYQAEPIEQGIGTYFTTMNVGRIGIAIIEDRKFKSGCNRPDMPPSGTNRPDHFNDPDFDVSQLDIPGVQLLGPQQLKMLREFAADWQGQDMKLCVSQTIFANMATHHGGGLTRLICDLDSNGWPQSGRNRAVDALRRGFVFHLAGDQHLSTIVHHGIEAHGDAIWSFCVPSIANFYPRAWAPKIGNPFVRPDRQDYTGQYRDGFQHPVTVYAATNPGISTGHKPADLYDKMAGYGIVRMNKKDRTITMECWPRYADPSDAGAEQYEGWPKTIQQTDNYAREAAGFLDEVSVDGVKDAVVQVINEQNDDLVYAIRTKGNTFRPWVYEAGSYTVKIGDPDRDVWQVAKGKKFEPPAATFDADVEFLKKHTDVIVLAAGQGARVAVIPSMQGRVMTSTNGGNTGLSFGWINRKLIASGKTLAHINAYGGEDRFWLGPEGGQYSIYFSEGAPFDLEHWQTPPPIDTEPFQVVGQSRKSVDLRHRFNLTNYSGTKFDVTVDRTVRLLGAKEMWNQLDLPEDKQVSAVAYQSANRITNSGDKPWTKESGLLSIWILGMYNPSPSTTVVVPIKPGPDSDLGKKVNADYFGDIPETRLLATEKTVFFRGDGQFRSKLGITPQRCLPIMGSYDADHQLLTIVQFTVHEDTTDFVNSAWEIQEHPYQGDVANSYNDGPPAPGAKPLGPFYELESSSPAAKLAPGASLEHVHRTMHFTGPRQRLDAIAVKVLGVSLQEIEVALPK